LGNSFLSSSGAMRGLDWPGRQSGVFGKNMGDNPKNGGDNWALGISL